MKYLKVFIHFIPLVSFLIFVVTDGIISAVAALVFLFAVGSLFISSKIKKGKKQFKVFRIELPDEYAFSGNYP